MASLRRRSALLIALVGALALSLGAFAYPVVVGSHMLPVLGSPSTPSGAHAATGDKDGNNTATGNDTGNDQGQANGTQDDQNEANDTENDQGQANETSDMNETQDGNDSFDGNNSQSDSADVSTMTVPSIVPNLATASVDAVPMALGGVALRSPVQIVSVLVTWTLTMPAAGMSVLASSGL